MKECFWLQGMETALQVGNREKSKTRRKPLRVFCVHQRPGTVASSDGQTGCVGGLWELLENITETVTRIRIA